MVSLGHRTGGFVSGVCGGPQRGTRGIKLEYFMHENVNL